MLNRDAKQFGKKYMFDGNDETCWNSDQVRYSFIVASTNYPRSITKCYDHMRYLSCSLLLSVNVLTRIRTPGKTPDLHSIKEQCLLYYIPCKLSFCALLFVKCEENLSRAYSLLLALFQQSV